MSKGYWTAIGIILAALIGYTLLIGGLGLHHKISTSVLDLVPKEQRDPELEAARALVQSDQNRILLAALHSDTAGQALSPAQRTAFIDTLRNSGAFAAVFDIAGEETIKDSAALFFALRGELLLPTYLATQRQHFATAQAAPQVIEQTAAQVTTQTAVQAAMQNGESLPTPAGDNTPAPSAATPQNDFSTFIATQSVEQLDVFLDTPEALAYQQLIPSDPLLLVFDAFNEWRSANAGLLEKPSADRLLVWAKLNASPFSTAGQQPVADALALALRNAQAQPGAESLSLQSSGVSRFAQANERGIRNEVAFFNIASISAVLLVCALMLRSPSVLFHTVAVLSLSLPFAWLITLLAFDSVPIIALVIGSVLVGVTIDYCLHVFLDGAGEPQAALLRPLLLSCGTTAIAFLALTLSPLPLLAQTGVFVATGLVTTCALALLYRRLFGQHIQATTRGELVLRTALPWKLPAALALLVLAFGMGRIEWNDSVDNLQYPLPELRAEDAAVRAQFGAGDKSIYLTSGATYAQAREALQTFENALPQGSQMTNLSQWTPLVADYIAAGEFLHSNPNFADALKHALDAGGYESESFEPFFTALQQWRDLPFDANGYETLLARLQSELPGPAGTMLGSSQIAKFFISSGTATSGDFAAPQGTVKIDTLYSLSNVFAHYRQNALSLSLWGAVVILVGSIAVYGVRRGATALLVPAVAGIAALGTVGFLQGELNLFHLIGLFLGVCLALDYGAFALRGKASASVPFSVCVAAATSVCSFGLLTLSGIPAVVALGSTVALCIVYGFLFALLLTTPQRRKKA